MLESRNYVFALQIEDSDRFIDIFGPVVSSVTWDDIVEGYKDIAQKLLRSYKILSPVVSPFWGRCFLPFTLHRPSIPIDMEEQVSALTAAGSKLIRDMLQNNLGTATGSKLNFKSIITPIQENCKDIDGINEKLDKLFKRLPCSSYPFFPITRDEFLGIIEKKDVETFVQPIVSLPKEKIVGYEALSRGSSNGSTHEADVLFGTASHLGLTEELELVCIEKALDWITKIPAMLWMSINIGPSLLNSSAFADLIFQERFRPFWPRLIFELTEHLPIDSVVALQETIRHLKNHGICLSLDDTGCGFFDLYTVETFRPKIVKLCITVIRRIGRSDDILLEFNETVSRIAEFGEYILGEGVEQKAQLDVLKQCGVSMAQGYYFDKPKPAKEVFESTPDK
jgi:EAL domain-containing protein (putative c-di-GMP-specific phosphodiesterase class I)